MSLDKAIQHGKEKRKPYRGGKAVDCTCRNHGSCAWCRGQRTHTLISAKKVAEMQIEEYVYFGDDETVEE